MTSQLFKVSAVAAAVLYSFSCYAGEVAKQKDPEQSAEPVEEVVTLGVRQSLENAAQQKRFADNIMDVVAAEELGKFPDQNVAESLQRVTGVAITRSRGVGQRLSVRGLGPQYNSVRVNNRLMPTDAEGREFNFDILPAALISGAEVIKSPTASMAEGSIGATVNVRTAQPLDFDGFRAVATAKQVYADLADTTSPEFSAVISNSTDDGTLGALIALSYVNENYRTDAYHPAALENTYGKDERYDFLRGMWRPDSQRYSRMTGDRKLMGVGSSIQWQPNSRLEVSTDLLYSRYEQTETQVGLYVPIYDGFLADNLSVDLDSLTFAHAPGTVPNSENTILSVTSLGRTPFGEADNYEMGQRVDAVKRIEPRFTDTYLIGANVSYKLTDTLTLHADGSTARAKLDGDGNTFYNAVTGFNGGTATYQWIEQGAPSLTFSKGEDLDVGQFRTHYTDVMETTIVDDIDELKLDLDWLTFNTGPLVSVQVGVAYADRVKEKTVLRASNPGANSGYLTDVPDELFGNAIEESDFLSEESGNYPRIFPDFNVEGYVDFLESLQDGEQYALVQQPGRGFKVEEQTMALFAQANFEGVVAKTPWVANVGVRHIKTDVTSTGVTNLFESYTPPFGNATNDNTDPLLQVRAGALVSHQVDYSDTLFSGNIRFDLRDDLLLRFAAAEVLTRPTLTDLSTSVSFDRLLLASAGNPALKPYRGKQFDVSTEWYPQESTSLSLGYFQKNLSSFVSKVTQGEEFIGADGQGVIFETTRPQNGEDAVIKGWEVAALHSFDYLPGVLSGFGVQGSLTLIDSESEFDPELSNSVFSVEGLSDKALSAVLFYDKDGFQARLSYTQRSDYLSQAFGGFGQPELVGESQNLDFSLSYDITDQIALTLEGNNITNERFFKYQVNELRVRDIQYTGARYWLGIRANF